MKSIAIRLSAAVLALMLAGGCAQKAQTPSVPASSTPAPSASSAAAPASSAPDGGIDVSKSGFPIVSEKISLKGLASKYELVTDWNEHKGLKYYEEQTNIHVEWDCVPDNSFEERRNLLFASRDLPDFVVRANLKGQQLTTYASAGQIIYFDDMLEDYAPSLTQLMRDDDGIRKAVVAADGHFYSLPSISEADGRIRSSWINKTYLDKLGIAMPKSAEEFRDALKAFRDQDANGNGQPDEVGISGFHKTVNEFIAVFYGSWGFGRNAGIVSDYMDVDDSGKIRFIPMDEEFRGMMEYFSGLWADGLIDKEIFSQDRNQVVAKMDDKKVGFVTEGNNFLWMGDNKADFVQNPPFQAVNAAPVWVGVDPKVRDVGCFVITSSNPHPEATLRWGDYFLSEEGTAFCRLGIKDVTYTVDEATGQCTLLPEYGSHPTLSVDEALSDYSLFQGGRMIMRVIGKVDQSAAVLPEMIANKDVIRPYLISDATRFRNPSFTEQETIDLSTYGTDITAYTNEQLVKFVTGALPMSDWDSFVSTLGSMNMDKYLEIYQAAYDRWLAL